MPKLVPIDPKQLIKILEWLGYTHIRTRGSHHFMIHEDWKTTVIPVHSNEQISGWLLLKILRDVQISKKQFELLRLHK